MRLLLLSLIIYTLPSLTVAKCGVALLLAMDVSGSVDAFEYRIQRDGLAAALRDPAVVDALVHAEAKVAVLQWSGSGRQELTLGWRQIIQRADAELFAAQVMNDRRRWNIYATAIGQAMEAGRQSFSMVTDCEKHVIDISGDGISNEGFEPGMARFGLAADGITVNALVIEDTEPGLADYYRREVLTGPSAFLISVPNFDAYPEAIRRKLILELSAQTALLRDGSGL